MTDLNTTNARVPHHTLVQVRELKELLESSKVKGRSRP